MNSFSTRVVSALVAAILIVGTYYFFQIKGLQYIISLAVVFGGLELVRILFKSVISKSNRTGFFICLLCVYGLSSWKPEFSGIIFAMFSISFCLLSLLMQEKFKDL